MYNKFCRGDQDSADDPKAGYGLSNGKKQFVRAEQIHSVSSMTKKFPGNGGYFFMCGITGFTGRSEALPFLLQGLRKLEYRGYDSAGITLVSEKGLRTWKTKGRLSELEKILADKECSETAGIGHTRWATSAYQCGQYDFLGS